MDNHQRLIQIFANVLNVDIASLNDTSSPDTVASWDSLAIVNLVTELEREFDVQFGILEIADFHSIGIVKNILIEKSIIF